jgi:nicotinamidase-related amidase
MTSESAFQPIVHLAIDVHPPFTSRLTKHRRNFPGKIREFADSLKVFRIPTLWCILVLDKEELMLSSSRHSDLISQKKERKKLFSSPERYDDIHKRPIGYPIYDDEDVYCKTHTSAFEMPLLSGHLKALHTSTLIITGMNTEYCVAATIRGAASIGFRCLVMTDFLADATPMYADKEWSPYFHRRLLVQRLAHLGAKDMCKALDGKIQLAEGRTLLNSGSFKRISRAAADLPAPTN